VQDADGEEDDFFKLSDHDMKIMNTTM
jgi:hypothetical protein